MQLFPLSLLLLPAFSFDRPVIGILTVPNQGDYPFPGTSFLSASYVKWVESAGARVVPLLIDLPLPSLLSTAKQFNGLLFPGGAVAEYNSTTGTVTEYSEKLCALYEMVKGENERGEWYPLWGTCLGMQMLHFCEVRGKDTIGWSPNAPARGEVVSVTEEAYSSRLFNNPVGRRVLASLAAFPIAYFSHNYSISPSLYSLHPHLRSCFTPLAVSVTSSAQPFISLVASPKYPIFASQFHPEVNLFDWHGKYRLDRRREGGEMAKYLAIMFVREARKTQGRMTEEELGKRVVENWKKYHWPNGTSEVYMFSPAVSTPVN